MSREPVRIGLVGYGRGGRSFHAPLIEQAPECVLAGVVTRSPQRRDELDKDHPGTPAHDDLTGLADAGVDAVVITTPLDTHEPLVREAITLRLPVVSDKPFTPDAASARDLVAAAERAEVLLSVYQNRRWDADFLTVRKLVEAGELGDVVTFESRMEQYTPAGQFTLTGGGVLRDFGSHVVDQALRLFGPAASVYAQTHVVREQHNFDDRFFLSLRHHNGVISHLWGNWALQGPPPPRFRVVGSTGTFEVESDDGQTERLLGARSPASEGAAFGTVPEARWGRLYRGEEAGRTIPAERGQWSTFYSMLAGALRGENDPPVDPWDAVAALTLLDAARTSAEVGGVVRLGGV